MPTRARFGKLVQVDPAGDTRQSATVSRSGDATILNRGCGSVGKILHRMDRNIALVIEQGLLDAFGKHADRSRAIDRTHVDVATADHRDNLW